MTSVYGLHEMFKLQEVMNACLNGIQQYELYRPHVNDGQLLQLVDKQLHFMTNEYNEFIRMIRQHGIPDSPSYRASRDYPPHYSLSSAQQAVLRSDGFQELQDRDIAFGIAGIHKSNAGLKMFSALEMAHPDLRRAVQQAAINDSEQAYEIWQYMNEKGFYPVPEISDSQLQTISHGFHEKTLRPDGPRMMGMSLRSEAQGYNNIGTHI